MVIITLFSNHNNKKKCENVLYSYIALQMDTAKYLIVN